MTGKRGLNPKRPKKRVKNTLLTTFRVGNLPVEGDGFAFRVCQNPKIKIFKGVGSYKRSGLRYDIPCTCFGYVTKTVGWLFTHENLVSGTNA